jgi:uroporphyrinogen-III synthase
LAQSSPRNDVLVTRPEPGASETAERVRALGFNPVVAPLMEIRTAPTRLPAADCLQAVLVTSRNAIAALSPAYTGLMIFAVGDATAELARQSRFRDVISASGNAEDLVRLAAQRLDTAAGALLLATGSGQGGALATALRGSGFKVYRRVVYGSQRVRTMPAPARAALLRSSLRAVLFFSSATARVFVERLLEIGGAPDLADVDAIAISRGCAACLVRLPWRDVRIAVRPSQEDVLAQLR